MRLILSSYQIIDATKSEKEAANKVLDTIQNKSSQPTPVGPSPIPKPLSKPNDPTRYRFRAEINGYFVRVVSADSSALTAVGAGDEKTEVFDIVRNEDGTTSFKSLSNGKFVSVIFDDETMPLRAWVDKIDLWEKFTVEESNGAFLLKTVKDGLYVQVDIQNGARLRARETSADTWERFTAVSVSVNDGDLA